MSESSLAAVVADASLRVLAAAFAVAIVLRLLRVRAPGVRHAAWTLVLAAMLLMPLLPSVVPALPVPVPLASVPEIVSEASLAFTPVPEPAAAPKASVSAMAAGPARDITAPSTEPLSRAWPPLAAGGLYGAVALFLLVRLAYGWHAASRMVRRARGCAAVQDPPTRARIVESDDVVVPVTVGVVRPVIVLPAAWMAWPAETVAAVLAHESAHLRRRDALVMFVARVNRALFWFHPLAWWLERHLAVTAEQACDDAAVQATGEPRRYASILLEMADAVRRSGGRVAWQGVGVDGSGKLEARIDRVLRDDRRATSRARRLAAVVGCVSAILLVVACRQHITAAPLQEDPEVAKTLTYRAERSQRHDAANRMTPEQAEALEQRLVAEPADFEVRRQLVTYYITSGKVEWERKKAGLRRHALWLIENHPEHDLAPPPLSPVHDPEGYAAARKLWDAHLARPDASPFLIYRAASFFSRHDKAYAEELIRRGQSLDPDSSDVASRMPPGVAGYHWDFKLAALYASAIIGSESVDGTYNDLRSRPQRLHTPYAAEVRGELDETTDARLLARVGSYLVRSPVRGAPPELAELGKTYLDRAVQIDPALTNARAALVARAARERHNRIYDASHKGEPVADADRLEYLASQASLALMRGENAEYYKKDASARKAQHAEARRLVEEVLTLADQRRDDPRYSSSVMSAHFTLASLALRDGETDRAARHLLESLDVPPSEDVAYIPPTGWLNSVNYLLKAGERDRVVEFLEGFAKLTVRDRDRLLRDAQAIREGRMPLAYQHMLAREEAAASGPGAFTVR